MAHSHHNRSARQAGHTLIGLLMAVSLVALLTTLAVPSFEDLRKRHGVTVVAEQLLADIKRARIESMLRGKPVALAATGDNWRKGWRLVMDSNANGRVDSSEPVLRTRGPLPPEQQVSANAGIGNTLGYRPDGRSGQPGGALQMGTLRICERTPAGHIRHAHAIVISATGRARLTRDRERAARGACAGDPGS